MKKKQKKSKKRKKSIKKRAKIKVFKKFKKNSRKLRKSIKLKNIRKKKSRVIRVKRHNLKKVKENKKDSLVLKLVRFQMSMKPEFSFKFSFSLEKYIQGFFDKVSETISSYKILKAEEKRRIKLEKIEAEMLIGQKIYYEMNNVKISGYIVRRFGKKRNKKVLANFKNGLSEEVKYKNVYKY